MGDCSASIATDLQVRHDHGGHYIGGHYMSNDFLAELRFLGITSSPYFVRTPEGNGVAERFIRTLKEQLLWGVDLPYRRGPPRGPPGLARHVQ